jgi:glutamyl-tRNA synthetase
MTQVKVRFAPSPTGFLHIGGLRTALFNFLFARKNQGKFMLRIEDTDKAREVDGAVENIETTLKTFALRYDEGPVFQSQRLQIYQEHIQILIDKGAAYRCYCTNERIAELKKQAELLKQPFRYDKYCLKNPGQTGKSYVVRQNIPEEGITVFTDEVYGEIKVENRLLDDGVLMKTDGYPVYNFANVVDDHLMRITHVIRGEEFISSTPKHVLLYEAFGWNLPQFVHLPLLLDNKRQKLSKRSGDVAVNEYLEKGYLPEAILNFIAFLGWNPKNEQEIFSLEELIEAFDLKKINKAGAVFDVEKLNWFNAQYIQKIPITKLAELAGPHFGRDVSNYPKMFLQQIVQIEKERLTVLTEIGERTMYFFDNPEYETALLQWKQMTEEELKRSVQISQKLIEQVPLDAQKEQIQAAFFDSIGEKDKGSLLWPLRVALTGLKASPGPFEIIEAFFKLTDGKQILQKRLQTALEKLDQV